MDKKGKIEKALRRHSGMSPEKKEAVAKLMAKQDDWYGTCRSCGAKLTGTIEQLKNGCTCQNG